MTARGLVSELVPRGIQHTVGVVAFEQKVEQAAAQPRNRQRSARVKRVHRAAHLQLAADNAEGAAAAESLQVEIENLGVTLPVKGLGQVQQLAGEVRAERRLHLRLER